MSEEKSVYEQEYSESNYWDKVKSFASAAGKEVIDKSLQLYYAMQAPATPIMSKTTIAASLGYFIFPLDVIPDFIPVVGYTDDLAVLVAAIAVVGMHITDEIKAKAKEKLLEWFGE